jgi:BMFP domain-containing protein YqiC
MKICVLIQNHLLTIMSKVNDIVSKYADKLKSFGINLSAVEEAVEQKQMAMAVLADGTEVYSPDAEFGIGSELFVMDAEGNPMPAPDGEHETAEGKILVVTEGKISEIKDKPMEDEPSVEIEIQEVEQSSFDGVSREEFETTISKLIEGFEAKINALNAEKQTLSATIEKMSKAPATDSVKKSTPVAQKQSVNEVPFKSMDARSRAYQIINSKK